MSYPQYYYNNSHASYQSTAYEPVDTGFTPRTPWQQPKSEVQQIPPTHSTVTIDGRSQPLGWRSLRGWLGEIWATFCSLGCFIAIIVVVRHYRGQGINDVNLPAALNLSGLVALLGSFCKFALMIPIASALSQEAWTWYHGEHSGGVNRRQLRDIELSDEASRSPWGSFLLLFRMRRNWLAYICALLTIITLVFGTFVQQLLTISTFPVNDSALMPGIVSRSEWWSSYFGRPSEGALQPPLSLKAATYSGALTASVPPLTSNCPTGNCTWPVTPSLGVCGGCVNSTWTLKCDAQKSSFGTTTNMCQYTLPSGEFANVTDIGTVGEGIGFVVFPTKGYNYEASREDIIFLANFEVVGAPNNSISETWTPADNMSTVAAECALWMCVQAFETKQINGVQTQTLVNSSFAVDNSSYIEYTGNTTFVNIPSDMNAMPNTNFSVYYPAQMAMQDYFSTLFNGNISLNQEEQLPTSDIIAGVWNSSSDLDSWIKSLAAGLSNVIRGAESPSPEQESYYRGTASQLGYDVSWPWITLPALCVAGSFFVLIVIMVRTARSPVRGWKGSPLALLFIDVDPELKRQGAGALDRHDGVEKLLGKTEVMLEDRGYGSWSMKAT